MALDHSGHHESPARVDHRIGLTDIDLADGCNDITLDQHRACNRLASGSVEYQSVREESSRHSSLLDRAELCPRSCVIHSPGQNIAE